MYGQQRQIRGKRVMGYPNKQRGMSFISILVIVAVVGFFIMIGLKTFPSYVSHYSIKKVLLQLEQDRDIAKKSPAEIRKLLKRRFRINNVYDFNPKNIRFTKTKEGLEVRIAYEVREHILGNVDIILTFDDHVIL